MWRKKLLEARALTTSLAGRWRQTCAPGGWRQEAGAGGQQRCPATRSSAVEELAWRCLALLPPPSSWGPWPHSSWRGSGCFAARAVASLLATPAPGTRWRGGRQAGAGWQGDRGPGSPGKHLVDLLLLLLPGKLPVPPAASLPAASCQPSAALPSTISLSHLCTRHLLAQRPLSANLRSSNFSSLTQTSASLLTTQIEMSQVQTPVFDCANDSIPRHNSSPVPVSASAHLPSCSTPAQEKAPQEEETTLHMTLPGKLSRLSRGANKGHRVTKQSGPALTSCEQSCFAALVVTHRVSWDSVEIAGTVCSLSSEATALRLSPTARQQVGCRRRSGAERLRKSRDLNHDGTELRPLCPPTLSRSPIDCQ